MFETENSIRQKDLEELAEDEIFESFKNKKVFITGASGLIGSELVLGLLCANRLKELNIKVVAAFRNLEKAKKVFSTVWNNSSFEPVLQDVNNVFEYNQSVDYIIHCASITASKDFILKPVETICTTLNGTKNVLDFARKVNAEGLVYLSSLEVYGEITKDDPVQENEYGYIDVLDTRSSYSEGKRLAETLCISYAAQYSTKVKIARLAQTFGAGVDLSDNRVFAQFAKAVVKKSDIVLHTDGKTKRNYCYLTDTVSAVLTILSKGNNSKAYNVANSNTAFSIRQMAEMLCNKYTDTKLKFEKDNINRGYNKDVVLLLNPNKLKELGWKPHIDLDEMFERTIMYLKEEEKSEEEKIV